MSLSLQDPALLKTDAFLAGRWVKGAHTFAVINPATGQELAQVADMPASAIDEAVDAAYVAQKSWAAMTALQRSDIMLRWHELIGQHREDLARILTSEMGKPLAEARAEIDYGSSFIQWFAQEARRVRGEVIPAPQAGKRIVVLKQPVGVVGSITPWNFPNAMIARKVAPALAAGCAFVARPAEKTPLSALALAELARRAGVPDGVLSVIPGVDAAGMGQALCTNPKVRKLTFTGSTNVGRILMRQCAQDIKKLSLELGGHAPFIVFDDADIDQAVAGAIAAKYRNSGQTCVCANRLYVQRSVLEVFAKKFAQAASALKVGNGLEDGVQIGPLIDAAALKKVQSHVDDALARGATLLIGGQPAEPNGTFYPPTVLKDVTPGMKILEEETFGPVAPIIAFDTVEEVIAMANDTPFGLASYFYARDLAKVWRVAEALEYGMVGINTGLISAVEAPFGGIKSSGLGREGSHHGIEDFLELKYLCMDISPA